MKHSWVLTLTVNEVYTVTFVDIFFILILHILLMRFRANDYPPASTSSPPGPKQAEPFSVMPKFLSLWWQTHPKSDTSCCGQTLGHVPSLPHTGCHVSLHFLGGLEPRSSGSTPSPRWPCPHPPHPPHGPALSPFHLECCPLCTECHLPFITVLSLSVTPSRTPSWSLN